MREGLFLAAVFFLAAFFFVDFGDRFVFEATFLFFALGLDLAVVFPDLFFFVAVFLLDLPFKEERVLFLTMRFFFLLYRVRLFLKTFFNLLTIVLKKAMS